jgi:hypothetical protein
MQLRRRVWLRTLADVVVHLGARGQLGLLDATEVRVRRPAAGRAGRRRFVSGKARANTSMRWSSPIPTCDCCSADRPARARSTIYWRALSRHLGRREHLDTILRAVAGLISSQEQAPRPGPLHRPSKALPAGTMA